MTHTPALLTRPLHRLRILTTTCLLLTIAGSALAKLDIVAANKESEEPIYVLKDTSSGKVFGTFWDRAKETSDYGFESSIVPDFLWSKDRKYVAVSGGASRSRAVSLYEVTKNSLKQVPVPQLTDEQAAPILAIQDTSAEGTDAVRWQSDGTLLLRFWAAGRVKNENEEPKEENVWADLEITGNKAAIVGTSSEEPSAPPKGMFPNPAPPADQPAPASAEEEAFDPKRLVGVHQSIGYNPDGTTYKGTVEIRVVKGVVGLEWKIGNTVSHGNGVLVGSTLGIALDSGLAIYRIVGQSEGISLIGIWSLPGSTATNKDAIVIGNADMTQAQFDIEKFNGKYLSLREVQDGQIEGSATISGGDFAKKVLWSNGGKTTQCQALALGEGLAVLTPSGLSVYEKHLDNDGNASLVGTALTHKGQTYSETLSPAE